MHRRPLFIAALALVALGLPAPARAARVPSNWASWNSSQVVQRGGYPVFTVDGQPFFIFGAAFFYERIPAMQWRASLLAYRQLGINTIDLYVIWNWHQPTAGAPADFTGVTAPERNLLAVLALCHELGFKVILRPGPVIRNEWRNGGYPDWLLERPEYNMPLHDVLEGRYPATATLQNAHADAAGAEWLRNETHLRNTAAWLHDVLTAVAPYAHDVIAVALDDDQGAYIDNDTWPAPHWRAYIAWLRLTVQSTAGARIPLFINTYESKVTAAAPVWAWGDWYQSDAYSIGEHDLSQLDFATGLLATQSHFPVMQAEFQAGWLQSADEGAPRPADPTNTTLALHELLRDGAHGIVDFPVGDTIDPDGWEAPWANWSYAWDAALTVDLASSPRYAPTAEFGELVRRYGALLADTHPAVDVGIVWPPSLFSSSLLTNRDFAAFADATIAMQRECSRRRLSCQLVDIAYGDPAALERYSTVVLPIVPSPRLTAAFARVAAQRLALLRREHRLAANLSTVEARPDVRNADDATLLLANERTPGAHDFIDAVNPSSSTRRIGTTRLGPREARLIPLRIADRAAAIAVPTPARGTPPPFAARGVERIAGTRLQVEFAPRAGARISGLTAPGTENAASSIGLLRDAVDPVPSPSARDYIAAYTHPLPAGTFNRSYTCVAPNQEPSRVVCNYEAPDLPAGGGRFERSFELPADSSELAVTERFTPVDPTSSARLQSISGFALAPGDAVVAPPGASFAGVLHGHRLAAISWRAGDVEALQLQSARGAELITLTFARPAVELVLGVYDAGDAAEAERLLRAKPPLRLRRL